MNKSTLTRIIRKILVATEATFKGVDTSSGRAEAQLRSFSLEALNERYYELFGEYHPSLPIEGWGDEVEHIPRWVDHSYESCGGW